MTNSPNSIQLWTPRVLVILFAFFISLFALDVFGEGLGFWDTILALLIHLIPTGIILLTLLISWKREWIGGIIFAVLPLLYIYKGCGRFPLLVFFFMCGPMILISVLYFINWKKKILVKDN